FTTYRRACLLFFFYQAEDGIRGFHVTGVQTCALPISLGQTVASAGRQRPVPARKNVVPGLPGPGSPVRVRFQLPEGCCLGSWRRSEERRVGKSGDVGGHRVSREKSIREEHCGESAAGG